MFDSQPNVVVRRKGSMAYVERMRGVVAAYYDDSAISYSSSQYQSDLLFELAVSQTQNVVSFRPMSRPKHNCRPRARITDAKRHYL